MRPTSILYARQPFPAAILFLATIQAGRSQDGPYVSMQLPVDCAAVVKVADAYLSEHGLSVHLRTDGAAGSMIWGRDSGRQTLSSKRSIGWTDAAGKTVTSYALFWNYFDRNSDDQQMFGVWHLRLSAYNPLGDLALAATPTGCNTKLRMWFKASGANVIGILPVDSTWTYDSNGKLERGYLLGIAAGLANHRP